MVMEEQELDMELDSERIPVPQVQKPSQQPTKESSQKVKGIGRGKPRFRKKMLHAAILKQMEFYFGDANLSKDRFLSNLIKEDPYVDLSIFTSFNKIRELTTDVHRIAKALQSSTMLTVSEDGTKVRRITPVVQKENVEECSVYAQNLPPDADHEWLSSIFSQYGPIDYISIPRYKSNKKIKGFAFIEFQNPKSAVECLKAFRKKGCLLPSSTSPNELLSISTYEAEKDSEEGQKETKKDINNSVKEKKNKEENKSVKTGETEESQEDCRKPGKVKKRKHEDMDCSDELTNSAENNIERGEDPEHQTAQENKVKDEIASDSLTSDVNAEESEKTKKRKHKDTELTEVSDTNHTVNNESADIESKKHKKRKNRSSDECVPSTEHGNVNDNNEPSQTESDGKQGDDTLQKEKEKKKNKVADESMDADAAVSEQENDTAKDEKKKRKKRKKRSKIEEDNGIVGLQVMAKKDWKHLRNKYLDLQKSKMKQLKQHLRKTRWNQWSTCDKNKYDNNEAKEVKEEKEKPVKDADNPIPFVAGVIVKIEMNEPCIEPKKFKMELKGNSSIKFIDVSEGAYEAYIRCDNPEAAQAFTQKANKEKQMCILQGEEEQMYWQKILQDRKEKLGNKNRPKQRGRDKLLKKAEKELGKHIKFDEV